MEQLTISEAFVQQLAGRRVCAGFFSTFSFEPEFFELEVLPLMLGNDAWSPSDELRYGQLQLKMQEPDQPATHWAVAYDRDIFESQAAPRLEVDYLPVSLLPACQHAKLSVLLLENPSGAESSDGPPDYSILLCAGSFNLTRAGWWENIEVGHWVELNAHYAPANIRRPLQQALEFYRNLRPAMPVQALQRLLDVLAQLPESEADSDCSFYFSFSANGQHVQSFPQFLEQAEASGTLQVVSPFFAEDGDNRVVAGLLEAFQNVQLFLPRDEAGRALISKDVYRALSERAEWAEWLPEIRQQLMGADGYRRLHAKIYNCTGRDGWHFIGSVNLSQQAFSRNAEAGFLLRGRCQTLLQTLGIASAPQVFDCPVEAESTLDPASPVMPLMHLIFDWQDACLLLLSPATGRLCLFDANHRCVCEHELQASTPLRVSFAEGRQLFARSSLVHARWLPSAHSPGEQAEASGMLLVSQRNLYGRPLDMQGMNLAGLLRLLHAMGQEERMSSMSGMLEAALRLSFESQDQYLSQAGDPGNVASFFSEFSEVNGAFWALGQRLERAGKDGDQRTLDYFLRGAQPDSLAGLLAALQPRQAETSPGLIVRYLTLLGIEELLLRHAEQTSSVLLSEVQQNLTTLEQNELSACLQAEGMDAERFIVWYRRQFLAGLDAEALHCDKDGDATD